MKKNYFMLAATAALFAACAETDLVNEITVEETQQAIGFDAFANKTTRAEITDLTGLQNVGFQVWGYKYSKDANAIVWEVKNESGTVTTEKNYYTVFDQENVTYNNDWGYTNTQYWDKTSKYNFYAVAPAHTQTTKTKYSINNGLITINNVNSGLSTDEDFVEYLIDRNGVIGREGTNKTAVTFNFSHIMSKISFKLKAGVKENIVVTSLQMYGYNNNPGKFIQKSTATSQDEWTISTTTLVDEANAIDIISANSSIQLPYNAETTEQQATADIVGNSYIMVPQEIAYTAPQEATETTGAVAESGGLKFIISYKIIRGVSDDERNRPEGDLDDEVFTNQMGTLQMVQNWNTNTHTTYTIIVKPDAIEFDNPTIVNWTKGTPDSGNLPL